MEKYNWQSSGISLRPAQEDRVPTSHPKCSSRLDAMGALPRGGRWPLKETMYGSGGSVLVVFSYELGTA